MHGVLLLLLSALLLSRSGAEAAASAAATPQRIVLPVTVNQVAKGEILVVAREGDVLARESDLKATGLRNFKGQRESIEGKEFVSLASLKPDLTFELDQQALALRISASPSLLESTALNLRPGAPRDMVYRQDPSGFLNYAVDWGDVFRRNRFDLFGEAGLSINGHLLFSSASRTRAGDLNRGLTHFTVDDRDHLVRYVAGDDFAPTDSLGGNLFIGGLSLARNFDIDPYFVRFPSVNLSGEVLTPSTADVYVNGILLRREQLPPGSFQLRDLPVTSGRGTTNVVVRDAFGREQQIGSAFYLNTGALAPGLQEYSYHVGFRRIDAGNAGAGEYGSVAFSGVHRLGLTSWLTAGLRFEAASRLASGGPTLTVGLPFGELEASGAASREGSAQGLAGSLSYTYLGRLLSFGGSLRSFSPDYANLSLRTTRDRPRLEQSVFAGIPVISTLSLTLQYTAADFRDASRRDVASAITNIRLSERINLVTIASRPFRSEEKRRDTVAYAGLTYFLEGTTAMSVSHERHGRTDTTTTTLQRSLPLASGYGYRLETTTTDGKTLAPGQLRYQSPYGRYETTYSINEEHAAADLRAAGGLIAIDGSVYPTRPVDESFALIRVPEVEGVRGYLNNQEIGRTNAKGDLPVPNLLPYEANRIAIADEDVPIGRTVGAREIILAAPLRGGALAVYPVERLQRFTGKVSVMLGDREIVPAGGELTLTAEGKQFASPVGKGGEFYLENVPPGNHVATVETKETRCSVTLEVPATVDSAVDLGRLRCAASRKSGGEL